MAAGTSLDALPTELTMLVLAMLPTCDLVAVSRTCRRLHAAASDDLLWRGACHRDWAVQALGQLPPGAPKEATAWREVYNAWAVASRGQLALQQHACCTWASIRVWLRQHAPEVDATICPGASEAELDRLCADLGLARLPDDFRALYRVQNGQVIGAVDELVQAGLIRTFHRDFLLGMLGGCMHYDSLVSVRLLTLDDIIRLTRRLRRSRQLAASHIVLATSFALDKKFVLDCETGALFVCTARQPIPATPEGTEHPLLAWLADYAQCLATDQYCMLRVSPDSDVRMIHVTPSREPLMSRCVTHNVEVSVSPVFLPEASSPGESFVWTYRISLRLLGEPRPGLRSCQLEGRRWLIRPENGPADVLPWAPGVIGLYPLLELDGEVAQEPFFYASRVNLSEPRGCMSGAFRFCGNHREDRKSVV